MKKKISPHFKFEEAIAICEQEGQTFNKAERAWAKKLWDAKTEDEANAIRKVLYAKIMKGEI